MDSCILICGCKKYEAYLRAALQYMKRPGLLVVGLLGDPALAASAYNDDILTVNVPDTYEYLPLKIWTAVEWISQRFPAITGIFKTDDDIRVHSVDLLLETIYQNSATPYWGFVTERVEGGVFRDHVIQTRCCDKKIRPSFPAANYCYGHGYWISAAAIRVLLDSHGREIVQRYAMSLEDVVTGHVLNQAGIYPVQIRLPYTERARDASLLSI